MSKEPIRIYNGQKFAQAVLMPVFNGKSVEIKIIDEVSENTDRGAGGFGHTGL